MWRDKVGRTEEVVKGAIEEVVKWATEEVDVTEEAEVGEEIETGKMMTEEEEEEEETGNIVPKWVSVRLKKYDFGVLFFSLVYRYFKYVTRPVMLSLSDKTYTLVLLSCPTKRYLFYLAFHYLDYLMTAS